MIISSCECLSSQEVTDFSDSPSPAGSTGNMLEVEEMYRSAETCVFEGINHDPLKEIADRAAKKRIIDETIFSKNVKKTKFEAKEHEKQKLFLKTVSPPKTADLLPPVVSPCVVEITKLPAQTTLEIQLASRSKEDQENVEENSSEHRLLLLSGGNPVRKITSPIKTRPEIQPIPMETKKETKEKRKRLLLPKKPDDFVEPGDAGVKAVLNNRKEKTKDKLKTARPTPKSKVQEFTEPVSAIKIHAEPSRKVDQIPATNEFPKRDSEKSELGNFKSPISPPPIAKNLATTKTPAWNPPGNKTCCKLL